MSATIGILWDQDTQQVRMSWNTAVLKNPDMVLAVLDICKRTVEQQMRVNNAMAARQQMAEEQERQRLLRQLRGE